MNANVRGLARGIKQAAAHAVTCGEGEREYIGGTCLVRISCWKTKVEDLLGRTNAVILKEWRNKLFSSLFLQHTWFYKSEIILVRMRKRARCQQYFFYSGGADT